MPDPHFRHPLVLTLMATGCSGSEEPVGTGMQPGTGRCSEPLIFEGALRPGSGDAAAEPRRIGNHWGTIERRVVGPDGDLCDDDAGCAAAAETLWEATPIRIDMFQTSPVPYWLIASTDGTPAALTGETLLGYLEPIDTAAEARLLAWSEGSEVSCSPDLSGKVDVVQATQRMSDRRRWRSWTLMPECLK